MGTRGWTPRRRTRTVSGSRTPSGFQRRRRSPPPCPRPDSLYHPEDSDEERVRAGKHFLQKRGTLMSNRNSVRLVMIVGGLTSLCLFAAGARADATSPLFDASDPHKFAF